MRPAGKARRPRIPGVFEGGATPPGGMQRRSNADGVAARLVTKLRLKPPSNGERSLRESSLLGGRCAPAKTASKASEAKTCFISPEHGFRRCLGHQRFQ